MPKKQGLDRWTKADAGVAATVSASATEKPGNERADERVMACWLAG